MFCVICKKLLFCTNLEWHTLCRLINQESSEQQSNDNVCMEQVIFVENFLRKIENCNVGLQMRRLLKSYQLGIDMAEGYRKNVWIIEFQLAFQTLTYISKNVSSSNT